MRAKGLLERIQNPIPTARMYLFALDGPENPKRVAAQQRQAGVARKGRRMMLELLNDSTCPERDATRKPDTRDLTRTVHDAAEGGRQLERHGCTFPPQRSLAPEYDC
jgi:hypothetical protein